jgi:hypothetical protein
MWSMLSGQVGHVHAVVALGDDLYVSCAGQNRAKSIADEILIVREQHLDHERLPDSGRSWRVY